MAYTHLTDGRKFKRTYTCFGWPFLPPMVVTMICPVSVPLPSTTVASISYKMNQIESNLASNWKSTTKTFTKKGQIRKSANLREKGLHTLSSLIFISFISSGNLSTPAAPCPLASLKPEVGATPTDVIFTESLSLLTSVQKPLIHLPEWTITPKLKKMDNFFCLIWALKLESTDIIKTGPNRKVAPFKHELKKHKNANPFCP